MTTKATARGDARERILLAAETLIARHGVDGVSVRAINAAAGVSPGILHYHFGGLDAVVEALLDRHMRPLIAARAAELEALQQRPAITIRDIVAILVLPLARKIIAEQDDGIRYIRLLARLHGDREPHIARIVGEAASAPANFLPVLLARALPEIPPDMLAWRVVAASNALLHTLATLNDGLPEGDAAQQQARQWQRVEGLIDFLCGGFAAKPQSASPLAQARR